TAEPANNFDKVASSHCLPLRLRTMHRIGLRRMNKIVIKLRVSTSALNPTCCRETTGSVFSVLFFLSRWSTHESSCDSWVAVFDFDVPPKTLARFSGEPGFFI